MTRTMSDKHGYMSVRTDAEWEYLFTAASLAELRIVESEVASAARADHAARGITDEWAPIADDNLRRDWSRITRAKLNEVGRRALEGNQ